MHCIKLLNVVFKGVNMVGFSPEWKEELKQNNNIVSVISKYVPLKQKGKTWWGCCPFHMEKTPSFAVNEYEGFFKCFGCGVGGDVITFIQKIESCDFYDACKLLARNAGMEMPTYFADENVEKKKKAMDRSYQILKDTAKYYYTNLSLPQAKEARRYMEERKLDHKTAVAFGIGYSLGWTEVVEYLKAKGYTIEEMKTAGIVEEKNGKVYDCYAKRLIFPIITSHGDVVGFSGRVIRKEDQPKYKNTADTIVFDKSRCVYGINQIKRLKREHNLHEIIIVEGQMDVISLYKSGVQNAVACMGTALTAYHAKEMKKFTDKVVVCFDGDNAGKKATLKSLDILIKNGLNVYVVALPEGLDPDEYVQKYSKDSFEQLVSQAKYWVQYLIDYYAGQVDMTRPEEKQQFVANALSVIQTLSTSSEQNIYLEMVRDKTNIAIDVLKHDLQSDIRPLEHQPKIEKQEEDIKLNAYVKAVRFVLSSFVHKKEYAKLDPSIKENLCNPDYIKLYEYIEKCHLENKPILIGSLYSLFDVENNEDLQAIVNYEFSPTSDTEQYYYDCVKTLKQYGLEKRQMELTEEIRSISDLTERRNKMAELQKIVMERNKIK